MLPFEGSRAWRCGQDGDATLATRGEGERRHRGLRSCPAAGATRARVGGLGLYAIDNDGRSSRAARGAILGFAVRDSPTVVAGGACCQGLKMRHFRSVTVGIRSMPLKSTIDSPATQEAVGVP